MLGSTEEEDHLVPCRPGRRDGLPEHGAAVEDQAREVIPAQKNNENDVNTNTPHERHEVGRSTQSDGL